jgi:hypothetical protein
MGDIILGSEILSIVVHLDEPISSTAHPYGFTEFPSTIMSFTIMDCPNEILLHIFRLACDDDGSTGRALSLVSRSVHELSKEYKYQSIAIIGLPRLVAFAAVLQHLPESNRRIRHLFFSSMAQNTSGGHNRTSEDIQNYVSVPRRRTNPDLTRGVREIPATFSRKSYELLDLPLSLARSCFMWQEWSPSFQDHAPV